MIYTSIAKFLAEAEARQRRMKQARKVNARDWSAIAEVCRTSGKDEIVGMVDAWQQGKHKRDKNGRFTSGGGSAQSGSSAKSTSGAAQKYGSQGETKQEKSSGNAPKSVAQRINQRYNWKSVNASIRVDGPRTTKKFISQYLAKDSQRASRVINSAKKYQGVLDNVTNFQKKFGKDGQKPQAGTYDAVTGEMIQPQGTCITFHQNDTLQNPYGAYDAESYAMMCAIAVQQLGAKSCNIGYFGNAQVSFSCQDPNAAMRFAVQHNQHSVYDPQIGDIAINTRYNPATNPIDL